MKSSSRILFTLAALGLSIATSKADQLGLWVSGANVVVPSNSWTLGYEFQVTSPVVVDGLAAFSTSSDLLDANDSVGLWQVGNTNPLATVFIPAGTPDYADNFAVGAINPILLVPGLYVVGSTGSYEYGYSASTQISTAPGIQYVEDIYTYTGGGPLTYPATSEFGSNTQWWGFPGGNIVVGGTVSAPDAASTWLLLGLGVAGLAVGARKRATA